jgi:peroxiredoxin
MAALGSSSYAGFTLRGELPPGLESAPVVVSRESLETRERTPVTKGSASSGAWELEVDAGPGLFQLQIGSAVAAFVAADGQVLEVALRQASGPLTLRGTPDQELYLAYEVFRRDSFARLVAPARAAASEARRDGNAAGAERHTEAEVAAFEEHRRELNDFTLEKLPGSAALYAASLRWDGDHRIDELAAVVDAYARRHPEAAIGRAMQQRIARFHATAVGAIAPDIQGPGPDGTLVALEQLRGEYVLVDFWAGWCPPCRVENRHYAGLYARHRDSGFEILAVSLDTGVATWRGAIAQDDATWLHVSDLAGWKSPLATAYNVSALPTNFLLDPEGRIIAKNVRGARLATLLEERLSP